MPVSDQHTIFYDGDCGFCMRSVRLVQSLDWLRRFRYDTLQSSAAKQAGLWSPTAASSGCHEMPDEMIVQAPGRKGWDARHWGGWRAVKRIGFRLPIFYAMLVGAVILSPWLAAAILVMLTPIGNPLGSAAYRWIARNRHRIPGNQCRLENR